MPQLKPGRRLVIDPGGAVVQVRPEHRIKKGWRLATAADLAKPEPAKVAAPAQAPAPKPAPKVIPKD